MKRISTYYQYLKQHAFLLSSREKLIYFALVGAFVALFLLFFQPFGVNNYDPVETITLTFSFYMFLVGLLVFLALWLNDWICNFVFRNTVVLRIHVIAYLLWTILFVSTCIFFFYNYLGDWHDFSWGSWLEFTGNFTALGIIPIFGITLFSRLKYLNELHQAYQKMKADSKFMINIPSENQNEDVHINFKSILYLKSEDNYVAIHYLENNNIGKILLRTNLKAIDELHLHPDLFRCHRSYMVNLLQLNKFTGNATNKVITLNHIQVSIPVSKTYVEDLATRLI